MGGGSGRTGMSAAKAADPANPTASNATLLIARFFISAPHPVRDS
jgi:hypothetical protein